MSSEVRGSRSSTSLQGMSTQRALIGSDADQPACNFAAGRPLEYSASNAQAPATFYAPGTLTFHQQQSQDMPFNFPSRRAGPSAVPPTNGPQLHAGNTQPPSEQESMGIPLSAHGETPSIAWQNPANGRSSTEALMQPSDPVGSLQNPACGAHVVPMLADNSNAAYRRPSEVAVSPGNAPQAWTLGTDSVLHGCCQNLPPPFKCSDRPASTTVPQDDPPLHLRTSGKGNPVPACSSTDSDSPPAPDNPSQAWRHSKENVLQECPEKSASRPKRSHQHVVSDFFKAKHSLEDGSPGSR